MKYLGVNIGSKLFYIEKNKVKEIEVTNIEIDDDLFLIYCGKEVVKHSGTIFYSNSLGYIFLNKSEAIEQLKKSCENKIDYYEGLSLKYREILKGLKNE